jgi:hypothetical protein
MKNSDPDSKVVTGALIGGLVGIGAIAIYQVLRKKESSIDHIGKVISNMGEILKNNEVEEPVPIKKLGKKLRHHEDTVGEIVDWIATGISLWKKFTN